MVCIGVHIATFLKSLVRVWSVGRRLNNFTQNHYQRIDVCQPPKLSPKQIVFSYDLELAIERKKIINIIVENCNFINCFWHSVPPDIRGWLASIASSFQLQHSRCWAFSYIINSYGRYVNRAFHGVISLVSV